MTQQQKEQKLCSCLEGIPFPCRRMHLAGNRWRGEISVQVCQNCGQYWLDLLYEPNVHDDDGEAYCGPISAHILETLPQEHEHILMWTLNVLSHLDWYYSCYFWEGHGKLKTSGPFSLLLMDHPSPLLKTWKHLHQR